MKNTCPSCASDNTQRLEVAFATHSNVLLGEAAKAPQKRRTPGATFVICLAIAVGLLGVIVLPGMLSRDGGSASAGVMLFMIAGALVFFAMTAKSEARQYNEKELPALMEAWRSKWICLKCGTIYPVETSVTSVPREAANA